MNINGKTPIETKFFDGIEFIPCFSYNPMKKSFDNMMLGGNRSYSTISYFSKHEAMQSLKREVCALTFRTCFSLDFPEQRWMDILWEKSIGPYTNTLSHVLVGNSSRSLVPIYYFEDAVEYMAIENESWRPPEYHYDCIVNEMMKRF